MCGTCAVCLKAWASGHATGETTEARVRKKQATAPYELKGFNDKHQGCGGAAGGEVGVLNILGARRR